MIQTSFLFPLQRPGPPLFLPNSRTAFTPILQASVALKHIRHTRKPAYGQTAERAHAGRGCASMCIVICSLGRHLLSPIVTSLLWNLSSAVSTLPPPFIPVTHTSLTHCRLEYTRTLVYECTYSTGSTLFNKRQSETWWLFSMIRCICFKCTAGRTETRTVWEKNQERSNGNKALKGWTCCLHQESWILPGHSL